MSETLTIQVDDTDPGISYTGDWIADTGSLDNLGNFGAPMMSTSHYIKGTGSFSYTFSGTYVGVFGSSVDGSNPSRTCTVDGATIPNNQITAPVNGIMHCQVFNLVDGKHTLVVTVSSPNPNGYWFDSLLYIPSASVSRANAMEMVQFDDPSFSFGAQFTKTGFGMSTTTNGASMSFQFTGRVATWMGYYQEGQTSSATTATYTVDGGSPFSFDLMAIPTALVGGDSNERFFTTGVLSQGAHTIRVTYNGNSGTTPLAIYSMIVQSGTSSDMSIGGAIGVSRPVQVVVTSSNGGAPVTITNTSPGAASSSTQSPQSPSVVVVGTGSSAVTITEAGTHPNSNSNSTTLSSSTALTGSSGAPIASDNASPGRNSNHLGAILGAVIGVLALFLLLLGLVLCRRSRKRRSRDDNNTGVEPFTVATPWMPEISAGIDSSNSSGGKLVPSSNVQFYSDVKQPLPLPLDAAASTTGSSVASPSQQSSGFQTQSSRSRLPASSSTQGERTATAGSEVVVLHEDSGLRIPIDATAHPGVTVVEMPPTYSPT
ncbi:hypothetical protein BJ912DRAFT_968977 [Pholiota molesta]|nr:hypothetical protein BJ912DRAFT_968977 [Pholiota molesta]